MKISKMLFIGLGGSGQRNLRISKELLPPDVEYSAFRMTKKIPLLNRNFKVNQNESLEEKYNLKIFNSLDLAIDNKPDIIVISTPNSLNFETAFKAAKNGIHIFIEKQFSHNLKGFEAFRNEILNNNLVLFISFQRRFHKFIRKTKEIIEAGKIGKIVNTCFNVCTYVPEWYKYEDYRELYACREDLGGGVLLTEIHEIDLAFWFFGRPESVYCSVGNYSEENLDVEDTIHLTMNYNDFSVQINLCFMQKHNRREFFIAGSKGYIEWNQDGNRFLYEDYESNETEKLSNPQYENDDMFIFQNSFFIENFMNNKLMLKNKEYLDISYSSLKVVEAVRQSIQKNKIVNIN